MNVIPLPSYKHRQNGRTDKGDNSEGRVTTAGGVCIQVVAHGYYAGVQGLNGSEVLDQLFLGSALVRFIDVVKRLHLKKECNNVVVCFLQRVKRIGLKTTGKIRVELNTWKFFLNVF